MSKVYPDNSYSIGNTPLVKINNLSADLNCNIFAKIEGRNPAFSVKCRIGAAMIWDAEEQGLLKPGMRVLEPTSGNTGIALAYVCAARGYTLTLTMPETMSIERRKVLQAFGVELQLTAGEKGMPGAIQKAEELMAEEPDKFYMPQQFKNPSNPAIHEATTGPEIWNDLDGEIDVLVAGIGTGGTITGVSRYLKLEQNREIISIGVEPSGSPVLTQYLAGKEMTPGPHKIQGLGAGFLPDTLDLDLVDRIEQVGDEEAMETSRRLAREEGILCGISCGAAMRVALRVGKEDEIAGKNLVVILPDAGERYLSTPLFNDTKKS